jgi:hypothetical protein
MRAGYDRVYRDTRRPPIPDLPIAEAEDRTEKEARKAFYVIGAVFGVLFLLGIVGGLYASLNGYVG